ncbi:DUF4041 domain-containing protein [uncultured Victivallis sp.]|uniref:DUF4041 domain-containing protein n=1 Tax=uncultured Victivallis sp. TaxID=354118 RepID=UPI0025E2D686|nr:DUF4041 domain-containing protein [uncultured Victivallis sp.]
MVAFISVLFAVLMLSLFGGAVSVLVDKLKVIKRLNHELDGYKARQAQADQIISERDQIIAEAQNKATEEENRLAILKDECNKAEAANQELNHKNAALQETIELADLNFYKPHYNFEKSLDYERALSNNRNAQKALIKAGRAVVAETHEKYSKKVSNVLVKLLLRTFNSESDLLIQNVDYKNVVVYENRLDNSFEQLNKWTMPFNVMITNDFLKLKIEELRIYHEFQEKKQAEAEEQRQIKAIMREEIRAEREMDKAKAEAEKEQQKYQSLLDKMMEAARAAHGAELEKMNAQIAVLQQQLDEAKAKERAISQAQLTKAGYVYVISNVGSFGENVFKIGMTRRLEPQERVDELGDASVPFQFDVHAMIYHENAPELESRLHQVFERNRVNKINPRKEFFRVSLDEIETVARQYKADVSFTKIAEAKEYRQSLAMESEMAKSA